MAQKDLSHYSHIHQSKQNICNILVYRMDPLSSTRVDDGGKRPVPIHYVIAGRQYLVDVSSGRYCCPLTYCGRNFNTREDARTHIMVDHHGAETIKVFHAPECGE